MRGPSVRAAASALVLLAAFDVVMLAKSPLDGQKIVFSNAYPCVRLLNHSGTIGCATRSSGMLAPLFVLHVDSELRTLLGSPPSGVLSVALAAPLFSPATMAALMSTFGSMLSGVLVLETTSVPKDVPSPSAAVPFGGDGSHAWNVDGSGMALERFPFAIVLLGKEESADVLACHGSTGDSRAAKPLLEVRYPMSARGDARSCLAADECLPLGGQSVWGSLQPRMAVPSSPTAAASATSLLPPNKPAAVLSASLDATSFFHDVAPGANAAVSSLVALLAAVDAIASTPSLASQVARLPSSPLFFLFTGEVRRRPGSLRLHFLRLRIRGCTCELAHPRLRPRHYASRNEASRNEACEAAPASDDPRRPHVSPRCKCYCSPALTACAVGSCSSLGYRAGVGRDWISAFP